MNRDKLKNVSLSEVVGLLQILEGDHTEVLELIPEISYLDLTKLATTSGYLE